MGASGLQAMLDLFFPPRCLSCDNVLGDLAFFCATCAPGVLEIGNVCCSRCSEPGNFPKGVCGRCVERPPPFMRAYAPFEHAGSVAKAIQRYKYENHSELARPLASLVAQTGAAVFEEMPGSVCPIPLHVKRYRERGYDQANMLAHELSGVLKRPLRDDWLVRERETSQQVGLSEDARDANVRGAFRAPKANVKGQNVLLVDDVFTTGATAREASRVLLEAGASKIFVVTVARARRENL